jgi:predicted ABC-type sugar transport system permease subunit
MGYLLEDRLRPPLPADPWSRDLLMAALLLILAAVLLPAWDIARVDFLHMVAGQMASYLLLPAMAFLLALRCGAIDLSVWVTAGVGGVVAASLIRAGVSMPAAFAAAAAAGLALGVVNGLLVAFAHVPSVAATAVVAVGAILATGQVVDSRVLVVPERAVDPYLLHGSGVLAVRVLIVAGVYAVALLGLIATDYAVWRRKLRLARRWSLLAALSASGVLAAMGGACFLIDNGSAPVPTRLVDDLRIPAAAVLAGGLFLGRRGRELLAGVSLPAALLIATIWRQKVWHLPAPGYGFALQLLVLTGMVIVVHVAFGRYVEARGTGRRLPVANVLMTLSGLALVAAAGNFPNGLWHDLFHAFGIAVWLSGTAALVIGMRRADRIAAAPGRTDDLPEASEE